MREGEVNGDDYFFITEEEFDENYESFFETVEFQFLPNRYAGEATQLDMEKTNILVASLEGFLSAVKADIYDFNDIFILVNIINDDKLDIEREGRDPLHEEHINLGVLKQFVVPNDENYLYIFNKHIRYVELPLSELKGFRNDKEQCTAFFNSLIIEEMQ